jgi:hypothetical protein
MTKGDKTFTWDGKADDGTQQPAGGTYTLKATATDVSGSTIAVTPTSRVAGVVTAVESDGGVVMLTVGGRKLPLNSVIGVTTPPHDRRQRRHRHLNRPTRVLGRIPSHEHQQRHAGRRDRPDRQLVGPRRDLRQHRQRQHRRLQAQRANFSSMVTAQGRTTSYSAGGVQAQTRQYVSQQGLNQSTNSQLDLAINGSGFFVATAKPENVQDSDSRSFTRAGSFQLDSLGYLQNDAGLYLQGWQVDANGDILTDPSDLSRLHAINVATVGGAAEPTTRTGINANLKSSITPSAAAAAACADAPPAPGPMTPATNSMSDYANGVGTGQAGLRGADPGLRLQGRPAHPHPVDDEERHAQRVVRRNPLRPGQQRDPRLGRHQRPDQGGHDHLHRRRPVLHHRPVRQPTNPTISILGFLRHARHRRGRLGRPGWASAPRTSGSTCRAPPAA